MSETQIMAIEMCKDLLKRLYKLKEIENVDELRLVLIKTKIQECDKILDEVGEKVFKRSV